MMTTITYTELVKRAETNQSGDVIGYSRDSTGLVSGPKTIGLFREGTDLKDDWVGQRIEGEQFEVTELLGWPHRLAAVYGGDCLIALTQ